MNICILKKISIFFILVLSYAIFSVIYKGIFQIKIHDDENIKNPLKITYNNKTRYNLMENAFYNAKNFIDNNIKGLLANIKKIKFNTNNPKISTVIPCYNCKNFVLKAIRSIQNQDYPDFEIVIVNDLSSDDTLIFLKRLQEQDPRITIITNKKNMGTLYSRAIGTLSSKGKYIFPLDSDDMFLDKDIFSTVLNIADKGKFDLIVFNSININLKSNLNESSIRIPIYERHHKANLVLFQPDLGYYPLQPGENYEQIRFEVYIFAKCIKSQIYKKALNKLGKERYSRYMLLTEDVIANYIIYNTAKNAKYIPKYGYLYIERKKSSSRRNTRSITLLLNKIYLLDAVVVFSKDLPKNKKILTKLIIIILKSKILQKVLNTSEYTNKLFISCIYKILNNKYISENDKNIIKNRIKTLNFVGYNP